MHQICWMLKGSKKHFFCIWLKVGSILSVKPINDFVCEVFCKLAVNKSVIYGVWFTTVDTITVVIYPISTEFFPCNDNAMDKFELKFFQLIFFACF